MNKIKNIEFLRIIGISVVVLLHLFYNLHIFPDISLYNKFFLYTRNGQKGVDLFFILTGFFFIYTLKPQQTFWEFFKKKLVRLYPCLIFVTLITFLFSLTGIYKWGLYDNILNLCFLSGTPLTFKHLDIQTGVFWYCSSMIWVLSLYRYLIFNYAKHNVNLWIALLVAFSYTFLIQAKGGKINNPNLICNYIFHIGFLRAVGGIGLGYFIGEWYLKCADKLKQITLNTYQSLIISGLEFVCLYFIVDLAVCHSRKILDTNKILNQLMAASTHTGSVDSSLVASLCKVQNDIKKRDFMTEHETSFKLIKTLNIS